MAVIVFGSLNMDLSIEADRIPLAGETVMGRGFVANAGGKGANQAFASARMGAQTIMMGAVGDDAFGDSLVQGLDSAGVDCTRVARLSGASTGVASIIRTAGDNRIVIDPGANKVLSASAVCEGLDAVARPGDIFLTQLECDVSAVMAALKRARELGMYTVLNPAPACGLPDSVWANVDLLCLNETECQAVCGVLPADEGDIPSALDALLAKGVGSVALTLGARGSAVRSARVEFEDIRSFPPDHEVADTTCAGDTYLGALVACLSRGMDMSAGVKRATCASALATTKVGAQCSIPAEDEVEAMVRCLSER